MMNSVGLTTDADDHAASVRALISSAFPESLALLVRHTAE